MPEIQLPIGTQFLHPPIGLLRPHLDFHGPYSDNQTLTTWSITAGPIYSDSPVADTFGVVWTLNGAIQPERGFRTGWVSPDGQYDEAEYDIPLAQLVVQHQFLSGAWVTTQKLWINSFPGTLLWDVALPGRIGLLVSPGLALDLFYLLVN